MAISLEQRLDAFREVTRDALATFAGGDGEAVLDVPGVEYVPSVPVRVRVRRRGIRYDLDDLGGAVEAAGRPGGWRDAAETVVAGASLNIGRRAGAVFVPAVEGHDIAALVVRVADTSLGVHPALLDLAAGRPSPWTAATEIGHARAARDRRLVRRVASRKDP